MFFSLDIKHGSFLTVMDDDDNEPWVNVVIDIEEESLNEDGPAFKTSVDEKPDIPKKVKTTPTDETNGHSEQNGRINGETKNETGPESAPKGVKRSQPDDGDQPAKKTKTAPEADNVVLVEDAGGAIVIGDD